MEKSAKTNPIKKQQQPQSQQQSPQSPQSQPQSQPATPGHPAISPDDAFARQAIYQANGTLQKILARAMYLNSIIEKYTEAEKYLVRALAHAENNLLQVSPQTLCDAACLYWEMGKEDMARLYEEKITQTFQHGQIPLARSKFIGTLLSTF